MTSSVRTSALLQFCITTLVLLWCAGCGSGGRPIVAAPGFSAPSGTYAAALSVTLSETTPGARVYYTTDGSAPTAASARATQPIPIKSSMVLKAVAMAEGYADSAIVSATYSFPTVTTLPEAATPVFSLPAGSYTSPQSVVITDATPGAAIYYTTNGTTPNTASTLYTGTITIASTGTIEAIAVANGYNNSAVASATYTITIPQAATPTFNPPAGAYTATQLVSISDATPGAAIYYTTNGTTPTAASTPYTGAITIASTGTIEAIAVAVGYNNSAVASATYTITIPQAATPTFNPPAGTYTATQLVSISDATPGAAIYYTTNGTIPTAASTPYTGAITVSSAETIEAIAVAVGYNNSAVASATYTIVAPAVAGQWTWMSGSSTILASGVYGTQGVASAGNVPGARDTASKWVDNNGNLWLFGGVGYDSAGQVSDLNDLWSYNLASKQWTWVSGSTTVYSPGSYGTLGVASSSNAPSSRYSGAAWIDSSGRLWLFGGFRSGFVKGNSALNDLWMFDPSTSLWTWEGGSNALGTSGVYGVQGVSSAGNMPGGREAPTGWTDNTGNFWLFGGDMNNGSYNRFNDVWMFSPNTRQWTWVSGTSATNMAGSYGVQGQAAPGNTPGSREGGIGWAGNNNNLYFFGGYGYTSTGPIAAVTFNDLWTFNTVTKLWTWIGGSYVPFTPGVYGAKGVSASGNIPGSRFLASGWADKSGNFWLLGGDSTITNAGGLTNDLWRYVP